MKKHYLLLLLFMSTFLVTQVTSLYARTPAAKASEKVAVKTTPVKKARKPVDWLRQGIIYQINTRAFTPEGTLKAAEAKLPHIASLGATIVYICPVFCADDDMNKKYWSARQKGSGMENPKNPYRIKDYFHVDPEYGTDNDLKSFVKTAHSLGLKVMFDLVYFHCGPTAVFLKDHPDFVQRDPNGNFITGDWAFPRLNFKSNELREYLYSNMEYFLKEFDVDGYRMDVGDLVPLDFWVEGRKRMEKIKPDVATLCEGMRGDDLLYAFDECYGFSLQFQYNKVFDKGESVSLLRQAKEKMAKYPIGAQYMHCVENHDYANQPVSLAKGTWYPRAEKRWGEKKMDAAIAFLFTLDGTPMLYCGQEIADKQPHSIFGKKNNFHIHWEDAKTDSAQHRLALVRQLAKMRKENKEFTDGTLVWLDNSTPDAVLSYERVLDTKKSLVVINFTDTAVKTVITKKDGSSLTMELAPFAWKIESNQTKAAGVAKTVTVDANFPCGNIIVDSIKGDTVKIHHDLRDTKGFWFYWAFRVRGAEGRTLKFEFQQDVIGARGPAVSSDEGVTWKWLGDKNFPRRKFEYTFKENDKSVIFACAMLYSQTTLERFLNANKDRFVMTKSVFCKSRRGRDVEMFRFGNANNEHKLGVLLTCRHHACEMTAAYVIEGLLEELFSGSETGNWLLKNVDFFWIPFVDKDGVEDGDQGKNRKPHDHNRDYVQKVHPEVQAMTRQIPEWSKGKRIMICDFHCPWLRDGINEILYFPGVESPYMAKQQKRFCTMLEKYQKNGVLPYKESFNLPFGKDWNVGTGNKDFIGTGGL